MEKEVKQEIWRLYFEEMYSYVELEEHFGYSYPQLRSVIDEEYEELR